MPRGHLPPLLSLYSKVLGGFEGLLCVDRYKISFKDPQPQLHSFRPLVCHLGVITATHEEQVTLASGRKLSHQGLVEMSGGGHSSGCS